MARRISIFVILVLGAMPLAGCENRDGSTDWGRTVLLGAGVGTAAAVVGGLVSDNGNQYKRGGFGHNRGYRGGYYRGY